MLSRSIRRCFSSDFAHKQVSAGFSKKYGESFDRIFGSRTKKSTGKTDQKTNVNDSTDKKSKSK